MRKLLFTDLDGTLIDFVDYSFKQSQDAIELVKLTGIPIIFCSSKTRVEQKFYLDSLRIKDPFIVENGSAIFVPNGYFNFEFDCTQSIDGFQMIKLGKPRSFILDVIKKLRQELEFEVYGYADLKIEEIMQLTKLTKDFAKRASQRDFSETLLRIEDDPVKFEHFKEALKGYELECVSGGKFHTVMGLNSDKGHATTKLTKLFEQHFNDHLITYGIGDSANDLPLLKVVDRAFLVQKPPGKWSNLDFDGLERVDKIGSLGWNQVAKEWILSE